MRTKNKNSTYVEICQQLELSINTVKAGLKKLVENNLIERNRSGNLHSTKIVPCFTTENRAQHSLIGIAAVRTKCCGATGTLSNISSLLSSKISGIVLTA